MDATYYYPSAVPEAAASGTASAFESAVGKPTFNWKRFLAFFIIAAILCTTVVLIWWFCYIEKPLDVDYAELTPKEPLP